MLLRALEIHSSSANVSLPNTASITRPEKTQSARHSKSNNFKVLLQYITRNRSFRP